MDAFDDDWEIFFKDDLPKKECMKGPTKLFVKKNETAKFLKLSHSTL